MQVPFLSRHIEGAKYSTHLHTCTSKQTVHYSISVYEKYQPRGGKPGGPMRQAVIKEGKHILTRMTTITWNIEWNVQGKRPLFQFY